MEAANAARHQPYVHYQYYWDKEGKSDEFSKLLNCFQAPLYCLLKNRFAISNPYPLFMEDPGFHLIRRADGALSSIEPRRPWSALTLFNVATYRSGGGAEGLALLEELLDQGHFILLQTHSQRVPFHRFYQSAEFYYDEQIHNSRQNHFFTIVGHDRDSLFYVDAPWEIRQEYFIPRSGTKEIGVAGKKDLEAAFGCFMNMYTFDPKADAVEAALLPQGTLDMLDQTRKLARTPAEERDGLRYENELQALDTLVEACANGELDLTRKSDRYDLNWAGLMEWKFETMRHRKHIVHRCMEMTPLFQSGDYQQFAREWGQTTTQWHIFVSKLRKLIRTQNLASTHEMGLSFDKLRVCENALMDKLDSLFAGISAS